MSFLLFSTVAFLGGVISLFSPCSGAIIPTYLAMLLKRKKNLYLATLIFAIGVIIITVPLGVGVSFMFSLLNDYSRILFTFAAVFFILLGFLALFGINMFKFEFLSNSKKLPSTQDLIGYKSIFSIGLLSGISTGSCAGPILGAIASLAAITNEIYVSAFLMFLYSLGIVLPLFVISVGFNKLEFLQNILVKGKLFKIHIRNKNIYIHSTNIIVAGMFFFLAYLFYFYGGSFGRISGLYNTAFVEKIFYIQDYLLELIY